MSGPTLSFNIYLSILFMWDESNRYRNQKFWNITRVLLRKPALEYKLEIKGHYFYLQQSIYNFMLFNPI